MCLPEQREALRHHARLIAEAGLREAAGSEDSRDLEEARAATERKLEQALLRGRLRVVGQPGPDPELRTGSAATPGPPAAA